LDESLLNFGSNGDFHYSVRKCALKSVCSIYLYEIPGLLRFGLG
jgi:hypothetical protein